MPKSTLSQRQSKPRRPPRAILEDGDPFGLPPVRSTPASDQPARGGQGGGE